MFAMWSVLPFFLWIQNIISKTYNEKIKFDDLNRFMLVKKFPDKPFRFIPYRYGISNEKMKRIKEDSVNKFDWENSTIIYWVVGIFLQE